jgi:hypothetical protein
MNRDGRLAQVGEAARKAARSRKFHWCRRENGFCDLPVWRLVATRLAMPLYQVVAFANRLEELANAAANYGEVRGNVSRFNAEEFGVALGMPAEDAARIFAELERPEVGWIAYDHVANFYDRNPDRIDEGAADRKRRQRLRESICDQLGKLARQGKIGEGERRSVEGAIGGTLEELRELQERLARVELGQPFSTGRGHVTDVTRDNFASGAPPDVTRDVTKSHCDIVTVTPEKSTVITPAAGDNFGNSARVEPESWPKVEVAGGSQQFTYESLGERDQAERWIAAEGYQLVQDMMRLPRAGAETKVKRWLQKAGGDPAALAQILVMTAAAADPERAGQFHAMVDDAIRRRMAEVGGQQLALKMPLQVLRGGSGVGHG